MKKTFPRSSRRAPPGLAAIVWTLLTAALLGAGEARAEDGSIGGQVYDAKTGVAVTGAKVVLHWPLPADDGEPRQEERETGADGTFEFAAVPAGHYRLGFRKPGYQDSELAEIRVQPGKRSPADFPLPPQVGGAATAAQSSPTDIEEFLVIGSESTVEAIQLRADSDQLLNVLSAEDLAKFAATDVGEGLKRVAGVNVVEGQFAVIRGLEDRYSSTTFNSAAVPSPDPDRQSVQLDLFPSEIVNDLVVAKTFAPGLPGNSAGGSIDVVTTEYPEDFEVAVKAKAGFNSNAIDRFLEFKDESPVGKEADGWSTIEQEYGGVLGGRTELAGREVRYKGLLNWEVDYDTAEGFQQAREPRACLDTTQLPCLPGDTVSRTGDLSLGELGLSGGRFDLTTSDRSVQSTGYAGLGFDLDPAGNHRIDSTFFYTRKQQQTVQLKEHGYLPNFDYGLLASFGEEIPQPDILLNGFATNSSIFRKWRESANQGPGRGPLWYTDLYESKSFDRERDLLVTQLNGEHFIDQLPGLHVGWAANYAHTTQEEKARGLSFFYEPTDIGQPASGPRTVGTLGPGNFAANARPFYNDVDVDENQGFGRMDADYTRAVSEAVTVVMTSGGWYEHAERSVDSGFLLNPIWLGGGSSNFAILRRTQRELGRRSFTQLSPNPLTGEPNGIQDQENDAKREIWAWNVGSKVTFFDDWDLLGGVRLENIFIESLNDAFTGTNSPFGGPETFPTRYLLFDHLDNPARNETVGATTFNSDLLGISVPRTPCPTAAEPAKTCVDLIERSQIDSLINGEIDELKVLPTAGFAVRPLEGLSVKGAWSKTVARPSFREMGYYVSVEPASDDLIIGNPQLQLSEVASYDLRTEYVFGDFSDLVAVSGFYKTIQDPIESIVIRDPTNREQSSSALYRTFFNNPNEAKVWGVEVEGRKNLGFLDDLMGTRWAEYFTLGANYTYIHARVDRIDAEIDRAQPFFGVVPGGSAEFSSLDEERRLFGQPEWIVNADLTFEQPDWGTKVTLAWYAISDVLDAAGSVFIGPNGVTQSYVPDRYIDDYGQLDLVASQEIWRGITLTLQLKNLTDSTRRIIYDPYQTSGEIPERSEKLGRDFKLQLKYAF